MRLLRVKVIAAKTCGGLLDGFDLYLRGKFNINWGFDPLCFIGPNGSGKSQFLQVLSEMFQSLLHTCVKHQEREESNPDLQFILEYLIRIPNQEEPVHVRVTRESKKKNQRPILEIERKQDGEWFPCPVDAKETHSLLPEKVVGYTSGDNETLSLPFLVSRSGYADEVGKRALDVLTKSSNIPDTRLMLIDYGTHLEVLVANLLLGGEEQLKAVLNEAKLEDIRSFRCVVQLAHAAAPKLPQRKGASRKGIQLTDELEKYLQQLQKSSTCFDYDEKTETYIFDFWVNAQTRLAFKHFWNSAIDLYGALHKLAMLNDLAIPKKTRERFRRDINARRFASRLPEPQDEDKVFRFERVSFTSQRNHEEVDYVSLSDGEHQLAQLLGTFSMLSYPNVCFLLDEPESHFNPAWRVKFISKLLDLPTNNGIRKSQEALVSQQECILTTHAPFVPSDMSSEKVFIFAKDEETGKIEAFNPDIETYGTTFDAILEACFKIRPPISGVARQEIERLMQSTDPREIREGMQRLGDSVEKIFLAERARRLDKGGV